MFNEHCHGMPKARLKVVINKTSFIMGMLFGMLIITIIHKLRFGVWF